MIKFLRKNNKKAMAVFSVGLMIAFAAQSRYGSGSGGRGATVIGHVGDDQITEGQLEDAHAEWRLLKQALVVEAPPQSGQYHPFLAYEFPPAEAIEQDPKLYLLLQKEADRMGTSVTDAEVQQFLGNAQVDIQMPSGSITRFDQMQGVDPDYAQEVKQATADFLRISESANQALDLIKFSRPLKDFFLSQDHQNISVRLVTFDANKLNSTPPVPTTQALAEQFEKYADVEPSGMGSEKNPLGFGYKIPDEVKLQTIAVSRKALKDAVRKSKSDYDWKVAAWGYYLKHQGDFATTQASATQPSPTTKPFDQVQAQVMDSVMATDIDALSDRVQKSIAATLAQDWASYHSAHPDTQPATAPTGVMTAGSSAPDTSSLGAPYASYDYLKALAAKVQKDFNVLPDTAAFNQPMASTDLSKLPGIGHSHSNGGATGFMEAAMDPSVPLLQPSAAFQDDNSTNYLFRVTEKIPSHRPASMTDLVQTVTSDWIKGQAYALAQKRAADLRDAAAKTGLTAAAAAAGLPVANAGPFSAGVAKESEPVEGVPLTGEDILNFKQKCQSILELAAKQQPPVAVVEAPNESKVMVIELADVKPDWASGKMYVAEADVTRELLSEFSRPLEMDWFTLPAVEARLGYVDVQKKSAG